MTGYKIQIHVGLQHHFKLETIPIPPEWEIHAICQTIMPGKLIADLPKTSGTSDRGCSSTALVVDFRAV